MSFRIEYRDDCSIHTGCGVVGVDLTPPPYPYYDWRPVVWRPDEAPGMLIAELLDDSTLEFLRKKGVS